MAQCGIASAQLSQASHKAHHSLVCVCPVQPGGRVVLAVGIVIAQLAVAHFITGQQLGRALCQQQGGQQRPLPGSALLQHGSIVTRAFNTCVVRAVLAVPVTVVLAIGLVVALTVRREVGQVKTVMGGDHVDACQRAAAMVCKQIT